MDPGAVLRSRAFLGLLLVAAVVGAVVSLAGWGFLGLVHEIQDDVDRPSLTDFLWTIPLGIAVALGAIVILGLARRIHGPVAARPTSSCRWPGSGQETLPDLVAEAGSWSAPPSGG